MRLPPINVILKTVSYIKAAVVEFQECGDGPVYPDDWGSGFI